MGDSVQLTSVKTVQDLEGRDNPAISTDELRNHPSPTQQIKGQTDGKIHPEPSDPQSVQTPQASADGTSNMEDSNCCSRNSKSLQDFIVNFYDRHVIIIWRIIDFLLVTGYFVYFGFAMSRFQSSEEKYVRLLWMTCVAVALTVYVVIRNYFGEKIFNACCQPILRVNMSSKLKNILQIVFGLVCVLGFMVYLIIDVALKTPENMVSLSGIVVYICIFYIFSTDASKIKWRVVIWGMLLQILFALFFLRTSWGITAFDWLGERVKEFMAHTDAGSKFVFGDPAYTNHFFAFKVLPAIIFFSAMTSALYYYGIMQVVIAKLAWVLQLTMGTSATEAVVCAGNVFLGMTEAPLLVFPILPEMTKSELHCLMAGGFATIAGAVMATYISMGVSASHLISASVMSAPCALAMSKLLVPETETPKKADELSLDTDKELNVFAALSTGTIKGVAVAANVAGMLISFLAVLEFLNQTLTWFGDLVGINNPPLTFQFICSYVLWPFAFMMGIEASDCRKVAELIGLKTFLNEFVAYTDLSTLIKNKNALDTHVSQNGTWYWNNTHIVLDGPGTVLEGGAISSRSIAISIYALCGFANFGAMGITIGALSSLIPSRKDDVTRLCLRAMITGNVACFMTACIAGLLTREDAGLPSV